jgi:hypothetical protein
VIATLRVKNCSFPEEKMTQTIHLEWEPITWQGRFRTGVSLHSHTLHSRESLAFLDSVARSSTLLSVILSGARRRHLKAKGCALDLNRGWWTPPLAARGAWDVEAGQIRGLGLRPIVSLTDHDDIEAPMALQLLPQRAAAPVSVEWSVPWRGVVLHVGVHNLPPGRARALFSTMSAITASPGETLIRDMIHALSADPAVLIVLNHPLWDEAKIGQTIHIAAARSFLAAAGDGIHALELNGLRPWRENRDVIPLAEEHRKPIISGGDRHGFEPNANLNLTNAESFGEFVAEVREGATTVLFMPQYRENHASRIFHNFVDILSTQENHARAWRLWSDRAFYICDDGVTRSLTEIFGDNLPTPVAVFRRLLETACHPPVRRFLRGATRGAQELA